MELFDIAGLKVNMDCKEGLVYERSRAYLADDQNARADFFVGVPEQTLRERHEKLPHLSLDECDYIYCGEMFYYKLLDYNGMLLHASAVEKDGYAYLFSAKSGVGKSTHTALWQKVFDGVRIINDDKPAIRKIDGVLCACGTPFSGKDDKSINVCVPLRAVVFLERAQENSIKRIEPKEAIPLFMSQTLRPSRREQMFKLLDMLDTVLKEIPVFKLKCNMSDDAANTAYKGVNDNLK